MDVKPATLTSASLGVTQAVARLRSLGFKVSTTIGHDQTAGEYRYRVRPPEGSALALLLGSTKHGRASLDRATNHDIMVSVDRPPAFMSRRNDIDARIVRAVEARELLDAIADSAVAQAYEAYGDNGGAYSQEDVIGVRFERSEHEYTVRVVDLILVDGKVTRAGSRNVDTEESTLGDILEYHTAPIGD